jgi:hypothetical protein
VGAGASTGPPANCAAGASVELTRIGGTGATALCSAEPGVVGTPELDAAELLDELVLCVETAA